MASGLWVETAAHYERLVMARPTQPVTGLGRFDLNH